MFKKKYIFNLKIKRINEFFIDKTMFYLPIVKITAKTAAMTPISWDSVLSFITGSIRFSMTFLVINMIQLKTGVM